MNNESDAIVKQILMLMEKLRIDDRVAALKSLMIMYGDMNFIILPSKSNGKKTYGQ